jgi:ankyrin repeat protein
MGCTHCQHCDLYAQFAMNPALQIWQVHYCQGDFNRCVRFQKSLRKEAVPLNMLPNGSKVEIPRGANDYSATALFNAILKTRIPMVESLLKSGIDVNAVNNDGMTPLMAAASTGNLQVIRLLLGKGANPGAVNNLGETAAQVALRHSHNNAAAALQAATNTTGKSAASKSSGGFLGRMLSKH